MIAKILIGYLVLCYTLCAVTCLLTTGREVVGAWLFAIPCFVIALRLAFQR